MNETAGPVGAAAVGLNEDQAGGGWPAEGSQTAAGAFGGSGDAEGGGAAPDARETAPGSSGGGSEASKAGDAAAGPVMTPEEVAQTARLGRGRAALGRALEEFRPFHSAFQIERFILSANGPTSWGAFVQASREIATRVEALKLDYIAAGRAQVARKAAIEDAEDRAREYEEQVKAAAKKFRAVENDEERAEKVARETRRAFRALKTAELDRSEAVLKLDGLRRTIADRERELGEFLAHFEALRDRLEADGPLTAERRDQLERELWREKTRVVAATEVVTLGGITGETIAILSALDPSDRRNVLDFINGDRVAVEKFVMDRTRPIGPTSGALPFEEVRALLCS